MLCCDIKCLLVQIRQFTFKFPHDFVFQWKYPDYEGNRQTLDQSIDLTNCFKITTVKKFDDKDGLIDGNYTEYEDIEHSINIKLPATGAAVTFELLDHKGEKIGISGSRKKASINFYTEIYTHKATILEKNKNVRTTLKHSNLDKMAVMDIEFLRTKIKKFNGQVDTEILLEHPNADNFSTKEVEYIKEDLFKIPTFFTLQRRHKREFFHIIVRD